MGNTGGHNNLGNTGEHTKKNPNNHRKLCSKNAVHEGVGVWWGGGGTRGDCYKDGVGSEKLENLAIFLYLLDKIMGRVEPKKECMLLAHE